MAVAERRTIARSAAAHLALIAALYAASTVRGCFAKPRRFEAITVFTVPDISAPRVEISAPQPPPPVPQPPPTRDIPEPAPKPPKPQVEVSRVKVTRPPPAPPPKPLTAEEVRRLLTAGRPLPTPSARIANPGAAPDLYLALVRKAMYDAWEQPGTLRPAPGMSVLAQIRVARDGSVLRAEVVRPSGHPVMDASVEKALRDVRRLPPLPDSHTGSHRDIQISFELTDS